MKPIPVPSKIAEDLKILWNGANLFNVEDAIASMHALTEAEYYEAAAWISQNPHRYLLALRYGMEPVKYNGYEEEVHIIYQGKSKGFAIVFREETLMIGLTDRKQALYILGVCQ